MDKVNNQSSEKTVHKQPKALSSVFLLLTSLGAALLIIGIMFTAFATVAYNRAFFKMEYRLNNTAEKLYLSEAELDKLTEKLVRYFSGKDDSLQTYVVFDGETTEEPFYTEDELSHMADVKVIFANVNLMLITFLTAAAVIFIIVLVFDKKRTRHFKQGSVLGSSIVLLIFIVLGLYAALDFDGAFTVFHKIFFPQGNWTFSTDMVVLLPQTLFFHATIIILCGGIIPAASLFTYGIIKRKPKKNSD